MSKGAFFRHFAGKDEMVAALLAAVAERFEAAVAARAASGAPFAEALVAETFAEVSQRRGLMATLIAVVAVDPSLAAGMAAWTEAWTARMVAEGVPEPKVRLVRLALDGLLLSSTLGDGVVRKHLVTVRREVERLLASGCSAAPPLPPAAGSTR